MEVQAVLLPDGISVLNANDLQTLRTSAPLSIVPGDSGLAFGAITLNVADVLENSSNELINVGEQVYVQYTDNDFSDSFQAVLSKDDRGVQQQHPANTQVVNSSNIMAILTEQSTDSALSVINLPEPVSSSAAVTHDEQAAAHRIACPHQKALQDEDIDTTIAKLIRNETSVSVLCGGDSSAINSAQPTVPPDDTSSSSNVSEEQPHPNTSQTVAIDISNPIELGLNSLIVVNGKKCVLHQNQETGQLVAYPVKDVSTKKRGRPKKADTQPLQASQPSETVSKISDEGPIPEDEPTEKGLIETANEAGELVKRSARKRKKNQHFQEDEYEITGVQRHEWSSEEDNNGRENVAYRPLGGSKRSRGRPPGDKRKSRVNPLGTAAAEKRKVGRPRRYGPTVQTTKPQPTQDFLVHTPDGHAFKIRIPLSCLNSGVSAESIAQEIANNLIGINTQADTSESSTSSTADLVTTSSLPPVDNNNERTVVPNDLVLNATSLTSSDSPAMPVNEMSTNETDQLSSVADHLLNDQNENATNTSLPESIKNDPTHDGDNMHATIIPLPNAPESQESQIKIGLKTSATDLQDLLCKECGHQSYYRQQYQDHISSAHPQTAQKCKCCSFLALAQSAIIQHYKKQHLKCICSICDYLAETPYVIRKHMARHNQSVSSRTCVLCGKVFMDCYIMKVHMKMVHLPVDDVFECLSCKKTFNRKAHLKRHLKTHNPERVYKCPQCEYRGCEKSDITKHMLVHEPPKHTCTYCGRIFRLYKNLDLHIKRHMGQRDYRCGLCDFFGYCFTDVRKHIERKHSNPKEMCVVCEKCGQPFKTEENKKEHQTSGQCDIFMLAQALQENDQQGDRQLQNQQFITDGNQTNDGLTSAALSEAALSAFSGVQVASSQAVTDGDIGEIVSSHVLDGDSQVQVTILDNAVMDSMDLINVEQESHPPRGEPNPKLEESSSGTEQFAVITEDGHILSNVVLDGLGKTTKSVRQQQANATPT